MTKILLQKLLINIQIEMSSMPLRPKMYAVAPEAYEAIWWSLVSFRQALTRPVHSLADPMEAREVYFEFVRRWNGAPTPLLLSDIMAIEGMLDQLPQVLDDCQKWLGQKLPPE